LFVSLAHKLGDFGLSRSSVDMKSRADLGRKAGDVAGGLSPTGSSRGFHDEGFHDEEVPLDDITAGVGTRLYASPEQSAGGDYDEKTVKRERGGGRLFAPLRWPVLFFWSVSVAAFSLFEMSRT
jgi:serine/threonine protein kinase